jgi:hypothetical protein
MRTVAEASVHQWDLSCSSTTGEILMGPETESADYRRVSREPPGQGPTWGKAVKTWCDGWWGAGRGKLIAPERQDLLLSVLAPGSDCVKSHPVCMRVQFVVHCPKMGISYIELRNPTSLCSYRDLKVFPGCCASGHLSYSLSLERS